ncbi:tryptophan-rich sensory protein [Lujinxingia sediminis]|uniref:Tryptophan-rich sensory protein n=1 Tax=Lujinxingia sediminis TaxID=2480984 RepID=A0ABY0CW77_9DELT|nr:tryptophan-rich sensory protein [Lujinxingia sediminis]RVU48147.1 tryptophan-rich sensory protein [Lujinxingia sediminis]
MRSIVLKVLALVVPPLAIGLPQLAAAPGRSVGAISDRFFEDVLIIPASYAFAVWGIIYAGILALAVAQILPRFAHRERYANARQPLIINMLFNAAWLLVWQSLLFGWALVVIVGQLASALWLYRAFATREGRPAPELRESWSLARMIRWPLGTYCGWLTLATVLNASSVLVIAGWEGWGLSAATWAVIMLLAAAVIGVALRVGLDEPAVALVFTWALVAVVLADGQPASVQGVAGGLALLFLILALPAARGWIVGSGRSERRRSEASASLPLVTEADPV